ncbi:hypothetical protein MPH_14090 [Macrophomina phaseolina MS6]|uniref:Uncharacterized protein n=1 Tax=Macrophomina phaseolina (strain MS6) TaxID=1126212 RepID=K2QGS0_MACPH|nr:hypothetical protein MPH_14090 [Macrophomina phaseolina MS6]
MSGFLIEPGMPPSVDHSMMELLFDTYGKTFQTWRWDSQNSSIPLGIPQLLMGYTGNSQITPVFVGQRDEFFGVNTTAIRDSREDISSLPIIEGADSWKRGFVLQLALQNRTADTTFTKPLT